MNKDNELFQDAIDRLLNAQEKRVVVIFTKLVSNCSRSRSFIRYKDGGAGREGSYKGISGNDGGLPSIVVGKNLDDQQTLLHSMKWNSKEAT